MATITNLVAINDIANGEQVFRVHGTVTVNNPAIEPVLVEPKIRHRGGWEVLELQLLDSGGIAPQVLTDKTVLFERAGGTGWKTLEVIHADGSQRCDIRTIEAVD
ncbi:hypothetical protein C6A77_00115 [Pseudomonas sp. AFG_SD02_1510_Pfu_092]|uniref:hypothetical protein n=1 Tax=Pseudomonas sp. AFG_SD02_1510_Pfu_092 TaxID=2259497 RepID=UPI000DEFBEFD|nr:hypothetical protein [Pseudomonas sp. AFG_SD02_1510_Pfu_092]RCL29537.1 hypothetical protein C6A77_00115 [Pseudomonas sp. AFG_SD02_1510_Pfu_092]